MLKVTIDTNILFDVIEERENKQYIDKIKELNDKGLIELRIAVTSASEKQKGGKEINNLDTFLNTIKNICYDNVTLLDPIMYMGISFWGHALWASEEMTKLEQNLFEILFPTTPYTYSEYCKQNNINANAVDFDWKNRLCDTQILWCHIYYDGDIFVTNDRNFHKQTKKQRLIDFGAGQIMYPNEALEYITNKLRNKGG